MAPALPDRSTPSWIVPVLLAFAFIVTWSVWRVYIQEMTLVGYGVEHFAYFELYPELFERDFPIGIQNYHVSLPMLVYPLALDHFGISPTETAKWVILAQAILMTFGAWHLARSLDASPLTALLVVVVLLVSSLPGINLSGFSNGFQSQISALYYGFAQGFRFFALAYFLRDRPVIGAIFLIMSIVSHPIVGTLTVAFVGAYYLYRWRQLCTLPVLVSFVSVALAGVSYLAWSLAGKSSGAETMALEDFVRASRSFSFHWQPLHRGFLTFGFQQTGAPILLTMLIGWIGLRALPQNDERTARLLAGCLAMIVFACLGVVLTDIYPVLTVIKISPQRGTEIISLFGVILAVIYLSRQLWHAALPGRLASAVALAALLMPDRTLFLPAYVPILLWHWSRGEFGPVAIDARRWSILGGAFLIAAGALVWFVFGLYWLWPRRFDGEVYAAFLTVLALVAVLRGRLEAAPSIALASAAAFLCLYTGYQRYEGSERFLERRSELAVDFKAAQDWARTTTPAGAVFMVDPSFLYGWRDYSRRPSFGNFHEWAMHGFGYDTDAATYREGLRRLGLFGLDPVAMAEAQAAEGASLWPVYRRLKNLTHETFNNLPLVEIMAIAKAEHVGYVVLFNRDYQGDPGDLQPVFQTPLVSVFEVAS